MIIWNQTTQLLEFFNPPLLVVIGLCSGCIGCLHCYDPSSSPGSNMGYIWVGFVPDVLFSQIPQRFFYGFISGELHSAWMTKRMCGYA